MNRKVLAWNAHFCLIAIGMTITSTGPALPHIIDEYEVSLTIAGTLFAFLALGRVIGVASGGVISDYTGRKLVMVLGNALLSLGLLGFAMANIWIINTIAIFLAGMGVGFTDGGSNAVVADIFPEKRGFALNRLHAFFGIGCLIGPTIAGILLTTGYSWRIIFYIVGVFSLAMLIYSAGIEYPKITREKVNQGKVKESSDNSSDGKFTFFNSFNFWLLAMVMFVYTGVGSGIIGWVNQYLEDVIRFSTGYASAVLALYNLGITGGRFGWSMFSDKIGYQRTILICGIGAFFSIIFATLAGSFVTVAAGYLITGFFLSSLYPTSVAYGSDIFPNKIGMISGTLITFAAIGSMVVPFLIGGIGDMLGLRWGMGGAAILVTLVILAGALLPSNTSINNQD